MERASKVVISRIQNRRGLRQNLPQPLRPGEIGLTIDTRQVWIGNEDIPPYGVRTYDGLVPIGTVSDLLDQRMATVEFEDDLTFAQFNLMVSLFARENTRLFPPPPSADDPAAFYEPTVQLRWDQKRHVLFGLRGREIEAAAVATPGHPWLSDFSGSLNSFLNDTFNSPTVTQLPAIVDVRAASADMSRDLVTGELNWQGRPGLYRVLISDNPEWSAAALGNLASIINTVSSEDGVPDELVTTLTNIEIGTIDEFDLLIDIPPDNVFLEPFRFELPPTGATPENVGFAVNAEQTDSVFIEYAISTSAGLGVGNLRITVTQANSAVVFDDRGHTGLDEVVLTGTAIGGSFFLQYVNPGVDNAQLSFIVRRWRSFTA